MNRTWKNKKGCFFDYAEGLFLLSVMGHWVLLNAIIDCFESVTGMVLALDSNPPKTSSRPCLESICYDFIPNSGSQSSLPYKEINSVVAHFLKKTGS